MMIAYYWSVAAFVMMLLCAALSIWMYGRGLNVGGGAYLLNMALWAFICWLWAPTAIENAMAGCFPWSPKSVEYQDGMTLCPGQVAITTLPIPPKKDDRGI